VNSLGRRQSIGTPISYRRCPKNLRWGPQSRKWVGCGRHPGAHRLKASSSVVTNLSLAGGAVKEAAYCAELHFQEIGIVRKRVSRRASRKPWHVTETAFGRATWGGGCLHGSALVPTASLPISIQFSTPIWLISGFKRSYRDVEELLAERGWSFMKGGDGFEKFRGPGSHEMRAVRPTPERSDRRDGGPDCGQNGCTCWRASITRARFSNAFQRRSATSGRALRPMHKLLKENKGFTQKLLTIGPARVIRSLSGTSTETAVMSRDCGRTNRAEKSIRRCDDASDKDATVQVSSITRSASSASMPPSTKHSICKTAHAPGPRCGTLRAEPAAHARRPSTADET